jgi:hypothetical protein
LAGSLTIVCLVGAALSVAAPLNVFGITTRDFAFHIEGSCRGRGAPQCCDGRGAPLQQRGRVGGSRRDGTLH